MTHIVAGQDQFVTVWVQKQLGGLHFGRDYNAIGIAKGGQLICGVVYHNYISDLFGNGVFIEMSIASIDKAWCTRHNLNVLFAYPFTQLRLKRVQATTAKRNKHARKFLERLGFTLEGIGRHAWPLGGHSCVYSMLPHECRWISHEQEGRRRISPSASSCQQSTASAG